MNPEIVQTAHACPEVAACCNLRPRPQGQPGLQAVGLPKKLADKAWRPLGSSGSSLLLAAGRTLARMDTANLNLLRELGTTASDPLCATSDGRGRVVVMCSDGAVVADTRTNTLEPVEIPARYHLMLTAADCAPVSHTTSPVALTGDYTADAQLTAADRRRVSDSLLDSYGQLCRLAADGGCMLQPALGRYRLLDAAGRELFASPPVLLGASTGRQCSETLVLNSAERNALPAYTLAAVPWRPRLEIPEGSLHPEVAAVEVQLTPMFHPVAPSARAMAYTMRRPATTEFLRVRMPGCESLAAYRARILKGCGRFEALAGTVYTLHNPLGEADGRRVDVSVAPSADFAAEVRKLDAALRRPAPRADYTTARLSAPHTFTASVAAEAAGTTLWGALRAWRFKGFSPIVLGHRRGDGGWSATVAVRFSAGERLVSAFASTSCLPETFGPLLSYPAPDATELEITLRCAGGGYLRRTFPLVPDESGLRSVWLSPTLEAVELAEEVLVAPDTASPAPLDLPGVVAAAESDSPLAVKAWCNSGMRTIAAIVPAPLSQNSWDFGRRRFYLFGSEGTLSATVADKTGRISLNRLDRRPVTSADAACSCDRTVWAATDSGDLLRIESSKVTTAAAATGAKGLAYATAWGELWARHADGSATVFLPGRRMARYLRPDAGISRFYSAGALPLVACTRGLCNLLEEVYQPIDVLWEALLEAPGGQRRRFSRLVIDLGAMNTECSVSLTRSSRTLRAPEADLEFTIRGQVLSPLRLPVSGIYPVRMLHIAVRAHTSPDFILTDIRNE